MENIKHKHKEGVQLFVNKELELEVRAVEIDGEGWLVGKDITEALGYSNSSDALKTHVDDEDKCKRDEIVIRDTIGRNQKPVLINESGLYSLILRSDMPNAKRFKRWVTSEVLPQIRKTGGYIPIEEEMSEAEIMAKALIISQK
ncbi:MAG: BRO family protein, partial [Clostridium celatum]|nr:BRO family protein [Clostridium celatum]